LTNASVQKKTKETIQGLLRAGFSEILSPSQIGQGKTPMQAQRFELKYIIPDSITPDIRAFVSSYLELDPFAEGSPAFSYAIHSIYLDSENLHTYHAGIQGDRNRFKLRVRYYDEKPDTPVFLELKRRHKEVIQKKRCALPRHALAEVLAGDTRHLRPKDLEGHAAFCHHMHQIDAMPRSHVAYDREAWVSRDDNSVRVTIDRNVRAEPCFHLKMEVAMQDPVLVFGYNDVLELKFTNRAPNWIQELVRVFQLKQSGGPKYANGIRLLGEHRFSGPRHFNQLDHSA
jgi:VTC domain